MGKHRNDSICAALLWKFLMDDCFYYYQEIISLFQPAASHVFNISALWQPNVLIVKQFLSHSKK